MTGTEKQVKFAESIRAKMVATIDESLAEYKAHPQCPAEHKDLTRDEFLAAQRNMGETLLAILAIEDHRFWIDEARGNVEKLYLLQDFVKSPKIGAYV